MKLVLNGLMMSISSILLMTVLSLGIHHAYAEGIPKSSEQTVTSAEQELIDLFFAAARTGNNEVITEFLQSGFPVDVKNNQGFTALMMATYYGHQPVVTTLLDHGANRCLRDKKGHTALMGAIVKAEWKIAKQLRQVDCDAQSTSKDQLTTLEFATVFGQEEKFKQLMQQ